MKRAGDFKCKIGQIVLYTATGATVFESRLILAHVDKDEYVSLSPAGRGSIVLDDLGVQGAFSSSPILISLRFHLKS